MTFQAIDRPIVAAVAALSEGYKPVGGQDLADALDGVVDLPFSGWTDVMFRLRDQGYLTWHRSGDGGDHALTYFSDIRLDTLGLQEVDGWPTTPGVSGESVDALVALLLERADETGVSEEKRGKLRSLAKALSDVGKGTASELLAAWLKSQGV